MTAVDGEQRHRGCAPWDLGAGGEDAALVVNGPLLSPLLSAVSPPRPPPLPPGQALSLHTLFEYRYSLHCAVSDSPMSLLGRLGCPSPRSHDTAGSDTQPQARPVF